MFKNRVRTAALAGAIAVATGVSGLTVPAYAQDGTTPQTDNAHNAADGSLAQGGTNSQNVAPVGEVRAAEALKNAATADQKEIKNHKFFETTPYLTRPIEANTLADLKAKEAEATALLNRSVKTLNDIDATYRAVKAETKAAEDAWAAYATATTLTKDEQDALVKYAQDIKAQPSIIDAIGKLWSVDKKPGDLGYVEQVNLVATNADAVQAFMDLNNLLAHYMNTSQQNADDIDEAQKASQIANQLSGYLVGYDKREALKADAINKTAIATGRNIKVLEQAWEIAQGNVRAARTLQAYYGVAARWVELYENDTILQSEGTTLRTEYFNVLFGSTNGANPNNGGAVQLEAFAAGAVANADSNLSWENEVSRVRLLDKKYRTDYATTPGAPATADKEKPAEIGRVIAVIDGMDNAAKDKNPKGEKPGPGSKDKAGDKKEGLPGGTIAAIVIGVLAALGGIIAVAFPTIQQFLPKF